MNKTEMAMKLAKKTGLSQGKAADVLDVLFSAQPGKGVIATALDADEKVTIPGFGTFDTKQRGERQGRNPATGQTITIPRRSTLSSRRAKPCGSVSRSNASRCQRVIWFSDSD